MDKEIKARLRKLSKEDILWVIERMCSYGFDNSLYLLNHALSDLEYKKELQRIDEADKYSKLAYQKRMEYIELLSSFDGKKLVEIPLNVLEKAERLMKEAEDADKKWAKLSNLKGV